MKRLGLLLALFWSVCGYSQNSIPELDLSDTRFEEGSVVDISGNWRFFWQKFLQPEDLTSADNGYDLPLEFVWQDSPVTGFSKYGYATYIINLKFSHPHPLVLKVHRQLAAGKIFFNGKLILEIGKLATDREHFQPLYRDHFVELETKQGSNQLLVQTAQFSTYDSFRMRSFKLGSAPAIYHSALADLLKDAIVLGAILIMALYHFYLWYLKPKRKSPLYFGMFSLVVGVRSLFTGPGNVIHILPFPLGLETGLIYVYTGFSLGMIFCVLFTFELYPAEFSKHIKNLTLWLSGLWTVGIVFLPFRYFAVLDTPMQMYALFLGFSIIFALIRAYRHQREGASLFLAGFAIFFVATINDILGAQGLVNSVSLVHVGLFGFIFCQSLILSVRFDNAYDRAENAEKDLRSLNQHLEKRVEDRTREIQTILENVSSGFLLIDRSLCIRSGFSKSCQRLIGEGIEAGQNIIDIFETDDYVRERLILAFEQIIEDLLPEQASLAQLPKRIEHGNRILGLEVSIVRDQQNNRIDSLLITVNDVTNLSEAEQEIRRNHTLISILKDLPAFNVFLEESQRQFVQTEVAINQADQATARVLLHTLKGNAAAYNLDQVENLIHELEDKQSISLEDLHALKMLFQNFIHSNEKVLSLAQYRTQKNHISVSQKHLKTLLSCLERNDYQSARKHLEELIHTSSYHAIEDYIGPLADYAQRLARERNKLVDVHLVGHDIKVPERLQKLLGSLIHLIRNAIDHGIEDTDHRQSKAAVATIRIEFTVIEEEFRILVSDDGTGIDPAIVRDQAIKQGIIKAEQIGDMDTERIYELIFDAHFSTTTELSRTSGRGVGMFAVKQAVDDIGGRIWVESKLGQGSQFWITVPLNESPRLSESA